MGKYASARNFGFGKNLDYAGREALRAYYADGHYGSVAAHGDRWNQFAQWAKGEGIKDLSKVDQQATAERYAAARRRARPGPGRSAFSTARI